MTLSLALYQPDIPQNTATLLRTGACLGIPVHVILPAGFVLSDKSFRRAGMDYLDKASLVRHADWAAFMKSCREESRRIILLSTKATQSYTDFKFQDSDVLLLGRESAGVPETVYHDCFYQLRIPMQENTRSLNIAISAAMVMGEAMRQTAGFPE